MKIIWVSWFNELAWGGDIVGYRNIHTNKVISKKAYDEMVEREILNSWNDLNEDEKSDYDGFELFRKVVLNNIDDDFEPLVQIIVEDDEDLEKYEPYIEL